MKSILPIFVMAFLLLFTKQVPAQINATNTGIIYITNATDTFSVIGAFTNASGSALTNNGVIQLSNNLINHQSTMTVGTGTLLLNGSSVQVIGGTQKFRTYNLVTNNALGITLNNNLSVSGLHTYTSGMITTSSTPNYLIYESGSSYSGSGDSRHVNGWVKKIGSTNFTFPVGNAFYERSISLTNLSASGEFDVKHNGSVTPNYNSLFNPLVQIDTSEYWTINRISGSSAQLGMNWDNNKIAFPFWLLSDVRATYYDGTFWRGIGGSASGSVLTTGSLTSNSTNSFNTNFTFGSISFVLPLKLISFTAGRMSDYTRLNWTIGNELNVSGYELERSDDGISFYTINVQGGINRNGTEFYSYADRKVLKGTAFYRLKINMLTGQQSYSHVVTVSSADKDKAFYVVTNPVDFRIDIYAGESLKGQYSYTLSGTGGQVMQSGFLEIKNGGIYSIYLKQAYARGAYILVVQNGTNRLQKTIIKQ